MDQPTAVRLLAKLGVTPPDIERVRQTPYPQSVALLDELKARVRSNWKKQAFELHPDRTGNDPEKTAEFMGLTQIRDDFEKLRVGPQPQRAAMPFPGPVPVQVVFVRRQAPSYHASPFTGTTSTASVSSWHFVNMKP